MVCNYLAISVHVFVESFYHYCIFCVASLFIKDCSVCSKSCFCQDRRDRQQLLILHRQASTSHNQICCWVSDCQVRCVAVFARCYSSLLFGFHKILTIGREIQISIWLIKLLLLIYNYKRLWLLYLQFVSAYIVIINGCLLKFDINLIEIFGDENYDEE